MFSSAIYKMPINVGQQEEIMTAFKNRLEQEKLRYRGVLWQMRSQHLSAQRQWKTMKNYLSGERGVWVDRYCYKSSD
jgi:Domain of unknown function (DUF4800)